MRAKRDGGSSPPLGIDQVTERLNLAVDRVMGEAGLWAPQLAALALRQAEGDIIEAAHLLRAYRSTRMRLAQPVTVHADELEILRRIVPAYRVPPGPQLLGRTLDYVGRLLEVGTRPRSAGPPATADPEPAVLEPAAAGRGGRPQRAASWPAARPPPESGHDPGPAAGRRPGAARCHQGPRAARCAAVRPPVGHGEGRDRGPGQPVVPQHPRPGRLHPRGHARRGAARQAPGPGHAPGDRAAGVPRLGAGHRGRGDRGPRRRGGGARAIRRRIRAVPGPQRAQGDRHGQPGHRRGA